MLRIERGSSFLDFDGEVMGQKRGNFLAHGSHMHLQKIFLKTKMINYI